MVIWEHATEEICRVDFLRMICLDSSQFNAKVNRGVQAKNHIFRVSYDEAAAASNASVQHGTHLSALEASASRLVRQNVGDERAKKEGSHHTARVQHNSHLTLDASK